MEWIAFTKTEEDVTFLVPLTVPRALVCKSSVLRQAVPSAEQDNGGESMLNLPTGVLQSWLQWHEMLCAQPERFGCSSTVANDARLLDYLLVRSFLARVAATTAVQEISVAQWHSSTCFEIVCLADA
jgi:hypothetical protein